jgi:hypothetical protein
MQRCAIFCTKNANERGSWVEHVLGEEIHYYLLPSVAKTFAENIRFNQDTLYLPTKPKDEHL